MTTRTRHCCLSLKTDDDPRQRALLEGARTLGFPLERLEVEDLYFFPGDLSDATSAQLEEMLCDPVVQKARWDSPDDGQIVEVVLRPGVTDPVAEELVEMARHAGLTEITSAASGTRYRLFPAQPEAERLARQLLANPVVHQISFGAVQPAWLGKASPSDRVDEVALLGLSPQELEQLSQERRSALDQAEMLAIQSYYQGVGRNPTDVEFETLAQTWSEHCLHKTFRARIQLEDGQVVDGLLDHYIRRATEELDRPWVLSAFVDNAGVIAFGEGYELSFKVETHNHPSALEPFGGANTGVGGVIRDVLGVSARPIAVTDVLCFAPPDHRQPEGVLPPRRIRDGVIAGVEDYGNKMGLPTVNGAVLYHPGYAANPLVYCGCLGIAPRGSHPREPQTGDRVVLLGGHTGRDGLRGATFSSMTLEQDSAQLAGASVQIGHPIMEKGLLDVLWRARDRRLYTAITDCGAGGLSSAVGEMASGVGADVELEHVRLKYPGLSPWEIWLSEAQERMVLAVPPENLVPLQELCQIYGVESTDLGHFTGHGRLVVRYAGKPVLELDNHFLHKGCPRRTMPAVVRPPRPYQPPERSLLEWLCDPNVASKEEVVRRYDHEVLGQTALKPFAGAALDAPMDAAVLLPLGTPGPLGAVLSCGINPWLGECDPYLMALWAVDEAVRNAVATGADPERMAILDNFCWGSPRRAETLGDLVEACRGCYDAARLFGTPFISGKDSLYNEYEGQSIPPTLLISALSLHPNVEQVVSSDLKRPGQALYLVGTRPGAPLERSLPDWAPGLYRALHQAMSQGLVAACHDASEGGVAVAAAEMAMGGRLGLQIALEEPYAERPCRLLVEVTRPAAFEAALEGYPCTRIGQVVAEPGLRIGEQEWPLEQLLEAWKS
ncbi:MAG: phosphoribosylformylglycinamidine synthase subunit PurL [Candidatus Xenobia bacterium]